jgi:hypothetical protein
LGVGGTATIVGKAEFDDDVCVSGNTILVGNLTVGGTTTIGGAVSIAGALSVGGATGLAGKLTLTSTDGIEIDVASGDPKIVFDTAGADKFVVGVDDDDSDKLKIDTGATVGGSTALEVASDKSLFAQHQIVKLNAQTGTTYTTVLTDANTLVTLNNGSAITLTIPQNSSVAYTIGTTIAFMTLGSGQVTIAGSGITFRANNGQKSNGQYSMFTCTKIDTDTWAVGGDTAD